MSCVQCGGKTQGWDFCEGCEQEIRQGQELEAAIQEEAVRAGAEAEAALLAADPASGGTADQPDPASAGEKPDQDQTSGDRPAGGRE